MKLIKITSGKKNQLPISGCKWVNFNESITSSLQAIDFSLCLDIKMKHTHLVGDRINIDDTLAIDKNVKSRIYKSPIKGEIVEIRRGNFRKLDKIIIKKETQEETITPLSLPTSPENALSFLFNQGLSFFIKRRPFNRSISYSLPKTIFINCIESQFLEPAFSVQLAHQKEPFIEALNFLATMGPVKLIIKKEDSFHCTINNVEIIKFYGSLAISSTSTQIEQIDPIQNENDNIWTLTTLDLLHIGHSIRRSSNLKKVALLGDAINPNSRGVYSVSPGIKLETLLKDKVCEENYTIISGTPLVGKLSSLNDHLGFYHQSVYLFPVKKKKKTLYFFRMGPDSFTTTNSYLSRFFRSKTFPFYPLQNGEQRAFLDGTVYDRVMPLKIMTMPLIKALERRDFDMAIDLGFLKLIDKDFTYATFICPSKIDLCKIVRDATSLYIQEYLAAP